MISSNFFSGYFSLFFFWDPYNANIGAFTAVPESFKSPSFPFILFSLFGSKTVNSIILSSISLFCSSVSWILLLTPSSVFFISIILFFSSIWFLYIFYLFVNLLPVFIYSSPEFIEHVYKHYPNSLLGRLLIPTSLSSSSGALSRSFIWNTFLSCLILPNSLSLVLCIC